MSPTPVDWPIERRRLHPLLLVRRRLNVSAVRHPDPARARFLLVCVEDDNGPVTNLTADDFSVGLWASVSGPPSYRFVVMSLSRPPVLQPHGFYEIELDENPAYHDPEDNHPDRTASGAQAWEALVFTVHVLQRIPGRVTITERVGEAIATTGVGYL
jgi:hypothetical protein